ncbi:putative transcriptional regulator [Geoglobus ahangari]|uniref:Putative transcriptional regulator n=1 Tax=Geoglobus ahangari TaxID=113653 RepID=A0A0F7IC83_9EURY|nr:helix-turn-helix domain-containing protein [Geoglobus ahangari]AKG90839.1 putative transcriptional regulator [Geoglobus ahangari]
MDFLAKRFAELIAGNIVFSDSYGDAIKKWRTIFDVPQKELAERLEITPSVISDYESNRRKSPGTAFIKKLVETLIEIDRERGWKTLSKYKDLLGVEFDVIIDIMEYSKPRSSKELASIVDGALMTNFGRSAMGHTVVDSLKAILEMSSYDFYRLYGLTSERALVFTKVSTGRSPMVAVRVANLKPSVVILNPLNSEKVDRLAVKIAEIEGIDLILTEIEEEEVVERLRGLGV